MKSTFRILTALALATVLSGAAQASAPIGLTAVTGNDDHVAALRALRRGEILPLARILAIATRNVPGDVIDVELERHHGIWRYEVKVLTSTGRVREVKLRAQDGLVLEIEDD